MIIEQPTGPIMWVRRLNRHFVPQLDKNYRSRNILMRICSKQQFSFSILAAIFDDVAHRV